MDYVASYHLDRGYQDDWATVPSETAASASEERSQERDLKGAWDD
jgi:hypothetical protein